MATKHYLEVTTNNDVDSQYLVDAVVWGLDRHNDAVAKIDGKDPLDDDFIDPKSISVLENVTLRIRRQWLTEENIVIVISLIICMFVGYAIGVQL